MKYTRTHEWKSENKLSEERKSDAKWSEERKSENKTVGKYTRTQE